MCQAHNESTSVSSTCNVSHIMRQFPSMYNGCFLCADNEAGLYVEMPSCVHRLHTYESPWRNNTDTGKVNHIYIWQQLSELLAITYYLWHNDSSNYLYFIILMEFMTHSCPILNTQGQLYTTVPCGCNYHPFWICPAGFAYTCSLKRPSGICWSLSLHDKIQNTNTSSNTFVRIQRSMNVLSYTISLFICNYHPSIKSNAGLAYLSSCWH